MAMAIPTAQTMTMILTLTVGSIERNIQIPVAVLITILAASSIFIYAAAIST